MATTDTETSRAVIVEDARDALEPAVSVEHERSPDAELVAWVVGRATEWRSHRVANYDAAWDRYERLFRGLWSGQERERKSERVRFVSPALAEAVENSVAEIEEAVFGRGDFFDFRPERQDSDIEKRALEHNKQALKEDLARNGFTLEISEILINAAVYGLGVGEIVLEDRMQREIVPQETPEGALEAGVAERPITTAVLRSVNPRNFLWDPAARSVDQALGVAVEEDVGLHIIRAGQAAGAYRECKIEPVAPDPMLAADQTETITPSETARVLRYYGLVPKRLLFPPEATADLDVADAPHDESAGDMVEAIVVIANNDKLLKAVENPCLMKDRPITVFRWDVVPGRLVGRGVCEKGETPQRLLDAELRSRIEALSYVSAPMMVLDATRLPRGFKFEVAPGRSLLVSGDVNTALRPLRFGEMEQSTWQQAMALDQMVQRATGSINVAAMAQAGVSGEARSGAVSMSLAGVVKRSKRSLMHFIDGFFIPTLERILWRNMQYNTERYVPINSSFVSTSSIGIMQREYELLTLTQLLASVPPGTPAHSHILAGVIANTGLPNRREVIEMIQQMAAPTQGVDPAAAQAQMVEMQTKLAEAQARVRKLHAEAQLAETKAQTEALQPELEARSLALKGIYEVPQAQQRAEFDRRMRMAETFLRQKDIESNERIARMQTLASLQREQIRGRANVSAAAVRARAEAAKSLAEAAKAAAAPAAPPAEPSAPPQVVIPAPGVVPMPDFRR